jgi:outer membrane biosynthesis protein TonB
MSVQAGAERSAGGTICHVRVAGTAIICIVAAFGAAFLVGRAVKHPAPAKAATPRTTRVADTVTTPTTHPHASAELVSQFTSVRASLKRRPKPHHRHKPKPKPKPAPVVTAAAPVVSPTTTTSAAPITSAPVTSAPVYHAPAPTSSGSTTHKKKSSGGSGTTTIGG